MPANLEDTAVATRMEKVSFHSNLRERQCQRIFKLLHSVQTVALISHVSKVMLKILQAGLRKKWTSRCPSWIEKRQRNQRSDCHHLLDHRKSRRVPEKHLILLYWLHHSLWLCRSQQTVENSSGNGNTRPPYHRPEKSVCRSGSNSSNWAWNKGLVPNWERSKPSLYIVTLLI